MSSQFPLSVALGLKFVVAGYDIEEVALKLGTARFNAFKVYMAGKSDFVCGHKTYASGHPQAGHEIHCIYAKDLEAFLAGGG